MNVCPVVVDVDHVLAVDSPHRGDIRSDRQSYIGMSRGLFTTVTAQNSTFDVGFFSA
jgi:hypothetical protein